METIETFTTGSQLECDECGATIERKSKVYQVVLEDGSGIDGPYCSERCVEEHRERDRETDRRIKLHEAAPDLLAACKAFVKSIDDPDERFRTAARFRAERLARNAIAKAEAR